MKPEDPTEFICKFLHLGKKHAMNVATSQQKSREETIYICIYISRYTYIRDHFYNSNILNIRKYIYTCNDDYSNCLELRMPIWIGITCYHFEICDPGL